MPISWSIRHYLIILVLSMGLPLVALLVHSLQSNYEAALQEAVEDIYREAELVSADTRRMLRGAEDFLQALALRPNVARLDSTQCDPVLADIKQLFADYANVGVLDRTGQMVCSAVNAPGRKLPTFGDFQWFLEAKAHNGFHISTIHVGKVSNKWVTTFSVAIRDKSGEFDGLVGYSFDLAANPLLFSRQNRLPEESSLTLVDARGHVVMRSPGSAEVIGSPHSLASELKNLNLSEAQGRILDAGESRRLVTYIPIEGTEWAVIADRHAAAVLDNLWLQANRQYLAAVVLVMFGTALAAWVASHIVRPIASIARTAAQVARGDASGRVAHQGPRELVHVASQFNHMLDVRLREERRYHDLFESASDGIVVVDSEGNMMLTNRRACDIFGYEPGALDGRPLSMLVPVSKRSIHAEAVREFFAHPVQHGSGRVVTGLRRDNSEFPCDISLSPLSTPDGTVVSAFVRDLSEWTRLEEQLAFMSRHDTLTGLPNRSLLADRLGLATARAQRGGSQVAVIAVDLDKFAHINDFHGLEVGDKVLKACADILRSSVREFETVVRAGSDEFIVLLEGADAAMVADRFVNSVRAGFAGPLMTETGVRISASFGIALFPCEGGTGELLKNADLALADARAQGGGTCRYFDRAMDAAARRRAQLHAYLHGALERGEFTLAYQPQVETATAHIVGVEALLRWSCPALGEVSPAEFIPLTETSGMIDDIGAWVLSSACAQAAKWSAQGARDINVAVNLSARQFRDRGNLLECVKSALDDSGIAPCRLELEITESMLMDAPQFAVETLHALKALGIRISIDDFGTGYSSLSYLRRFPVHALKVDQSFVRDLVQHRDDREIVGAIISLAHSLNLDVVAEGVETEEQRSFLKEKNCSLCQGYLFSRPVEPHLIAELLKT
jgi:diguanylate cyclase (GGDEF)-like protein/PAS domain S-box-containing protein